MILFYLLILVMPLASHPLWGRSVGGLTVTKYLGAACLVYAIFHLGARRTLPSFFQAPQVRWFVLLYLVASVSYFTQALPRTSWAVSPFLSYSSFLLLAFITLALVDSLERLRSALLAMVGSGGLASLYVLREWQKYHNVYPGFRPGWVVGDANFFSVSAMMCVPVAFCLIFQRRSVYERLFCLGCLLLTVAAVIVAASRGGFLGLVAAFLFIVWRSPRRARNLALACALLLPLSLLTPASPVERLLRPSASDQEAVENRTTVWKAGLRMIQAHPLCGIGLGNFKPMIRQYEDAGARVDSIAHNSYIEIAAEMGLPSLLIFLGILSCSFRSLGRVWRETRELGLPLLPQAALGIQAALVGSAVSIFFVSGQYEKSFWLLVFFSTCLVSLAKAATAEKKEAAVSQKDWAALPPVWGVVAEETGWATRP